MIYGDVKISIRAPARGATSGTPAFTPIALFQSALPRGERHCLQFIVGIFKIISIRAPARGATYDSSSFFTHF